MPRRIDYFKVRGTAYYVYADGMRLSLDVETVIESAPVSVHDAWLVIHGENRSFNEVAMEGLLEEGRRRTPFTVEDIRASFSSISLLEVGA